MKHRAFIQLHVVQNFRFCKDNSWIKQSVCQFFNGIHQTAIKFKVLKFIKNTEVISKNCFINWEKWQALGLNQSIDYYFWRYPKICLLFCINILVFILIMWSVIAPVKKLIHKILIYLWKFNPGHKSYFLQKNRIVLWLFTFVLCCH